MTSTINPSLESSIKRGLPACLTISMLLASCAGDPHQNYVDISRRNIGRNIQSYPQLMDRKHLLLEVKPLASGRLEYRYRYYRSCVDIYEVDPKTHIILDFRWEGSKEDCVIYP